MKLGHLSTWVLCAALGLPAAAAGEESAAPGSSSTEDLAKQTQNPVASLISVPLQSNFNFGVGPNEELQYIMNVQPVVPIGITDDWNVITRPILPIISQPFLAPGVGDTFGLGDMQLQLYLSPAKPGALIWGAGPVFQFPTATDESLGTGRWAAGPAAVALTMQGPWVFGALANNLWSFAGDDERPKVNQLTVQPFVNYNLPDGWYVNSAPIITANWEAEDGDTWTVPLGAGVGKIVRVGKLPINLQLASYYNVVTPEYGAEWQLRFQVQLLFPR